MIKAVPSYIIHSEFTMSERYVKHILKHEKKISFSKNACFFQPTKHK